MPENRNSASAIAIQTKPEGESISDVLESTGNALSRAGNWAGETAQQFGALVSALMGPAVFSAYAFAFWSLAQNLGWTDTFVFVKGPLSNWFIWMAIAILVTLAASVLRRHTLADRKLQAEKS